MRTICLVVLVSLPVFGADGDVEAKSPCVLPDFASLRGMATYATAAEYATARADRRFACDRLVYRSGDLEVVAYVYGPAAPGSSPKLPVVVFNRGGYAVPEQAPQLLTLFHRLASEGFLVVAPMYRGSAGASGHDEMGGADLDDLRSVTPLLRNLSGADPENVFLYGASRGGVMTFMALRDGFPAKAAATFGGFTDLSAYLSADPRAAAIVSTVWPEYAERAASIQQSRSALRWADRIRVPILLMHGGADNLVNPAQTLQLGLRLQDLGRTYSLVVFAGDDHSLTRNRVERDQQATNWFRQHLSTSKQQPAPAKPLH